MMKRHAFYAAMAAAIVFVGCSDDEYLSEGVSSQGNESAEITFSGASGVITRATEFPQGSAAEKLNGKFVVVGYKNYSGGDTIKVFDYYTVSYENTEAGTDTYSSSNTTGWEYVGYAPFSVSSASAQTVKYWDNKATSYDFYAFSLGSAGEYGSSTNSDGVTVAAVEGGYYTLEGNADNLSKCYISDMKTIKKGSGGYTNSAVVMTFRSLAAKVRMAIYETVPGYSVQITKFYTSTDDSNSNTTTPTLIGTVNKSGTYKVSFDKTTANYNKAKVTFTAAQSGATDSKLQFSSSVYTGGKLGEDAANASYCGSSSAPAEYTTILPNEDNGVLTLKVDYTLTSTDNSGETITVTGATAVVPAAYAQWKPGYAYTYLFKITNETNGTTGDPNDPTGLTAISFDACVVEQVETPIETTTTVATPSITTYAYNPTTKKGSTNEYYAGDSIYASVVDNGTLVALTASNVALYTLTGTGVDVEMTETAVIAALEHGTNSSGTYTLTSNSKTLTVTLVTAGLSYVNTVRTSESTTISLGNNALMWTANKNTTYAVVYNCTDNSVKKYACKVVTVGSDVPAIATISAVKAGTTSLEFSLENVPAFDGQSVTATLTKTAPEAAAAVSANSCSKQSETTTYKATFSDLTLTKNEVYVVTFTYKRANGDEVTLTEEFTVQAADS